MSASQSSAAGKAAETYDVVVVGAGFGGMYMLHRLRGQGFSVRVYEQGGGVGGTWYWNRYPGARCDVESMQYSYSFSDELQQEWDWSERYAPQPEILRYANHVADRFDLRTDIQFNTAVKACAFDERDNIWSVTTSDGRKVTAKFVVLATGCLSNARRPDIKGLESFKGQVYHTGNWPHEAVDFTGLRVGIIGTGSSGIQSVPVIAEQAKHLTVFQRTPNYSIPARNAPLTDEERKKFRDNYPEIRRFAREVARNGIYTELPDRGALDDGDNERRAKYEARWQRGGLTFMSVYNNLGLDKAANDTAADFVREKIARDRQGSGDGKTAAADDLSDRHQAHLHRHRLFRDLQPAERDPGRHQDQPDRGNPAECRAHRRQGLRDRRAGARDGLRRHDRLGREDRHQRPRRADAEPEMGGGPEDLSRPDERGLPEPLHHHRSRQPVGALEHDRLHRAACRLDHRCICHMRDRGFEAMEAEPAPPKKNGWPMSTRLPTPRSIRRPIPGTWAPTSPASRASSCPISVASGPTGRSATRSPKRVMRVLR